MNWRITTSLEELEANPPRRLLLLYSGGVDGSYLLGWLRQHYIQTHALIVKIGAEHDTASARERAAQLGVEVTEADATEAFFRDFLPAAIHADAWYQGRFPVSSTLTRPLMARTAAIVARDLGCDAIAHSATYMQNTALRIGRPLVTLAPDIDHVAPFLASAISREDKIAAIERWGLEIDTGVHSIDENPWARVIECGSLESPENVLDESVFVWTRDPATCAGHAELELRFRAGLPTAVNGDDGSLGEIVQMLNGIGGAHGIGRHSGLEDTPFGVKNHEIREAPAATILSEAHAALVNAVCPMEEFAVRSSIAQAWTNSVVHGGWFGTMASSLAQCLANLDDHVTGDVHVRLERGHVTVLRTASPHGLYYSRLGDAFHEWMGDFSYAPWLMSRTVTDRARSTERDS